MKRKTIGIENWNAWIYVRSKKIHIAVMVYELIWVRWNKIRVYIIFLVIIGPTIVFKKVNKTFYACSACRDRKECNFYAEYDEKKSFSKEKLDFWRSVYKDAQKSYMESYKMYKISLLINNYRNTLSIQIHSRREKALKTSESNRFYCQTCYSFVLNERDIKEHSKSHKLLREISEKMLKRPILEILEPIVLNSSNAV